MATETQTSPQLTVLTRVASIPLVNDTLNTVHSTLSNNAFTRAPYSAAQVLGNTAYRVSEPIQAKLAPVIQRADGYANAAVDMVESRYPYPFKTTTEEIYSDIKKNGDYAVGVANKTIDDRVKAPAFGIAQNIDQRFAPVVDRLEGVVSKMQGQTQSPPASPTEPQSAPNYQYQRAIRLSIDLKDHLYCYTTEQVKQIQEHNVLVQRLSTTIHSLNETLSTSYGRVHALSDKMLVELQRLQSSTAALPSHLQAALSGLTERVTQTVGEVAAILKSDAPMDERMSKLGSTIGQKIQPLLETTTTTLHDAIQAVRRNSFEPATVQNGTAEPEPTEETAQQNGNAEPEPIEKTTTPTKEVEVSEPLPQMNGNGNANGILNGDANGVAH